MEVKRKEVTSGEMITDKMELAWRIENYSMIWKSDEFRRSQKLRFQAGSNIGLASDWIAYFEEKEDISKTPEGTVTAKKVGHLCVGLERIPEGLTELMAALTIKIKVENIEDGVFSRDAMNVLENRESSHLLPPLKKWELSNAWELPLINGSLVMELDLTLMKLKDPIPLPLPKQSQQQIEALFKPRFAEKMVQDLDKLLEGSNVKSDATIVSKDKVEFPVHRCILSLRSPVFETMFRTPMTEAQSGIVVIPDLSSKTVAVLLRYMYTGTLDQAWSEENVLPELVNAANKYALEDLVDFLDQAVGRVCTKENAGKLLSLLGKIGMKTGEREVLNLVKSQMESFEDMARFVDEGTREPDILQNAITPANQRDTLVKENPEQLIMLIK